MEETLSYMTDDLVFNVDRSDLQAALDKWDEFQEKLKTKIKQAIKDAESADEDDDAEGAD